MWHCSILESLFDGSQDPEETHHLTEDRIMRSNGVFSVFLGACVATATRQGIDTRVEQVSTDPNASFGTGPIDDAATVPAAYVADYRLGDGEMIHVPWK